MTGNHVIADQTKSKIGLANGSKQSYKVIFPDGSQETVSYLNEFCKSHNIQSSTARAAAKNKNITKSGFRFERLFDSG